MSYVINHKLPASELIFGLFNHHNNEKYSIEQLSFSNPKEYTSAGIQDTRTKITALIDIPEVDVPTGHITYRRIDVPTLFKDCGLKLPRNVLFPAIDMPAIRKLVLDRYGLNIDEGFSVHAITNKNNGFAITAANSNVAYVGTYPIEYFRHLDGDRVQVKSLDGFKYRPPNTVDMWGKVSTFKDGFGGSFVDVTSHNSVEVAARASGDYVSAKTYTNDFRLVSGYTGHALAYSYTADILYGTEQSEFYWEVRGNRSIYKLRGRVFANLGNIRMPCDLANAKIVKTPDDRLNMIYGGMTSAWFIRSESPDDAKLCGNIEKNMTPLYTGLPQYVTLSRPVAGSSLVTDAVIRTWADPDTGKQVTKDVVLTNIGEELLLAKYTVGKQHCIGMSKDRTKYYITTKPSMRALIYWEVDVVLNTVRLMRLPAASPLASVFKNSTLYGFYEHGIVAKVYDSGKWVQTYFNIVK